MGTVGEYSMTNHMLTQHKHNVKHWVVDYQSSKTGSNGTISEHFSKSCLTLVNTSTIYFINCKYAEIC